MNYKNKNYHYYCTARNKAWEVLINCKISSMPISLNLIKKHYGIKIIPYSKAKNYENFKQEMKDGDGFSTILNGHKIIYFNDKNRTIQRIRFTIAHELGHCLLGHDLSKTKYRNSETDSSDDPIEEMQANVFARDILMPAIILHHTDCINYKDIMKLCNVSEISAKIREKRMKLLEERNKFCTSPLEKQVYDNFEDFIINYKNKFIKKNNFFVNN